MDSLIYEKIYSYYTNALPLNEAELEAGAAQLAEAARRHRRRLRQKSEGQGYQTLTLIFCFDIRTEPLRRNRL